LTGIRLNVKLRVLSLLTQFLTLATTTSYYDRTAKTILLRRRSAYIIKGGVFPKRDNWRLWPRPRPPLFGKAIISAGILNSILFMHRSSMRLEGGM